MKANFKSRDGRVVIEVQGETVKDLFRGLSQVYDVFESESACGCCGGTSIRPVAREHEDNEYYELACLNPDCGAKFSFGQHKKGNTLFPKRKDENGALLPNRGWRKWEPSRQSDVPINARRSQ